MDRNATTENQNSADVQASVQMHKGQMDRNATTENQNSIHVQDSLQIPKGCSTNQTTYAITRRLVGNHLRTSDIES